MKKNLLLLIVFLGSTGLLMAQGITFEKGSLAEAIAKARADHKLLFVDISTFWCGPCQQMAREVFPKSFVGGYYNNTFVNYKLDGDSKEGKEMTKKFKTGGFPAFLFLDGKGNMVYQFLGYRNPVDFVMEAEKVPQVAKFGGWEKMDTLFQEGSKDPDFLKIYYEFSDKRLKPKVLNAYLKALPENQLITKDVAPLYGDIVIYDVELMNRLADAVVKYKDIRTDLNSSDYNFYFTSGVEFCLTRFLDDFIADGDRKKVDEVLGIYRKLNKIRDYGETDVDWSPGRGTIFMPQNLIDLIYARKNPGELNSFLQQMPVYMEKVMSEICSDSILAKIDRQGMNVFIHTLYNYLEEPAQFFVANMLDYVDCYWRHSPSDKKTIRQCIMWVKFLSSLNPYDTQNPFRAADLLVRLHDRKDALAILGNVQAFQEKIKREDKTLNRRIGQKVFEIRNNK